MFCLNALQFMQMEFHQLNELYSYLHNFYFFIPLAENFRQGLEKFKTEQHDTLGPYVEGEL